MKLAACDICLAEKNKLSVARYRAKRPGQTRFCWTITFDTCADHRDTAKGLSNEKLLELLLKAETNYNAAIRS